MSSARIIIISAIALAACRSEDSHVNKNHRATSPESFSTQDPYTANDIRTRDASSDSVASSHRYDSADRSGTAEESFDTSEGYAGTAQEASARRGASSFSSANRDFVTQVFHCGRFEVQSSELALQKGITGEHRDFAEMMVTDHGQVNRELERIAQRKGMAFPVALDAKHEAKLEELRELDGAAFAKRYHDVQTTGHEKMVQMLEQGVRDCDDAEVKAVTEKALASARRHLEMLNEMGTPR